MERLSNVKGGLFLLLVLLGAMAAPEALAGTATGLPWENPLQTFRNSITGPVAFSVSLVGIVVAGGVLIWGGEINEFARRSVMLAMVIALMVAANNVLTVLFGVAGAVVA